MTNYHYVQVSGGVGELIGFVSKDADLDGVFTLIEEGTEQRYKVHGWNVQIDFISGEEV